MIFLLGGYGGSKCCVCGANLEMTEDGHGRFRVVCAARNCGAQGGLGSSIEFALQFGECIMVSSETKKVDIDDVYPENIINN